MRKRMNMIPMVAVALSVLMLSGCQSGGKTAPDNTQNHSSIQESMELSPKSTPDTDSIPKAEGIEAPVLLYMGQASIRIATPEGKVIYIDPYAGSDDDYEPAADLILVTHSHFDHSAVDKVTNRSEDCQIITQEEAIQNGEHVTFDLGYVKVEPVEAGYNSLHDVSNCVGYVLTFSNGKSIYVTGDTSKTEQMAEMSEMQIDYAFYCCDGVYNMGPEEAAECAELVGAKHNIPYHNTTTNTGDRFDRGLAQQFDVPNRMIVGAGEEIRVE